jgi:hypothetical protein
MAKAVDQLPSKLEAVSSNPRTTTKKETWSTHTRGNKERQLHSLQEGKGKQGARAGGRIHHFITGV